METSKGALVENRNDVFSEFASQMASLAARVAQLEALLAVKSDNGKAGVADSLDSTAKSPNVENDSTVSGGASVDPDSSPTATRLNNAVNGTATPLEPTDKENATAKEPRVQSVVGSYDETSLRFREMSPADGTGSNDTESSPAKNKTILRRIMDDYNKKVLVREEIEIDSVELRRLVTTICTYEPWPSEHRPIRLSSPFPEFVWYWDEFKSASVAQDDDTDAIREAREDLTQLMDLLEKSQLEKFFKTRKECLESGTMPYEYLWTLFRPGTKVYAKSFLGEMQMFEVVDAEHPYYSTDYGSAYSSPLTRSKNRPEWTESSFPIRCQGFDWDGAQFNVYAYTIHIRKDSKDTRLTINSLDVIPTSFYRGQNGELNDDDLKESLIRRGKRFSELCTSESEKTQYKYNGFALVDPPSGSNATFAFLKPARLEEAESRSIYSGLDDDSAASEVVKRNSIMANKVPYRGVFLVDTDGFMTSYSTIVSANLGDESYPPIGFLSGKLCTETSCTCVVCNEAQITQWLKVSPKSSKYQHEEFCKSSDRLAMCPPRILGYALKDKIWAQVLVKPLQEIKLEGGDRYFKEQLQLEESYKEMLLAFIKNHQYASTPERSSQTDDAKISKSYDTAEGKGQGLAVLLHGPPGVGKTLTAETIALATGRPLLSVSVAEIGIDASQAESRLKSIFVNAERWRAVLLMDEADVFLEARVRTDDPNRNAMVSVLLRCLEYYEGIIILTTNRIKSIDIAVQSRMHLAIQYLNLNPDQMLAIYKNLLGDVPDNMLREGRKSLEEEVKRTLCGRRSQMNGRQIRNIVSTARALAASRNEKLRFDHLRTVYDSTAEFLEGLKDVNERAKFKNQVDEA